MIWCRFQAGSNALYGIVEGDSVVAVDGSPFGDHARTSARFPLHEVKLLIPVVPPTFYAAAINYRDHVVKMAQSRGETPKFPEKADIGYRANNALIAHGENIVKPKDSSEKFQYEGELVAVIGRKARHVPKERALDCVFGWTIGNDVSERTWQKSDRTFWRAKNADTFKPMGPWIVTDPPSPDTRTTIRLNGRVVDTFQTLNMIFDTATYIAEITKYNTLYPGDVLWLGTDGGPENMKPGDIVEIEITGIGVLRNQVVAEA